MYFESNRGILRFLKEKTYSESNRRKLRFRKKKTYYGNTLWTAGSNMEKWRGSLTKMPRRGINQSGPLDLTWTAKMRDGEGRGKLPAIYRKTGAVAPLPAASGALCYGVLGRNTMNGGHRETEKLTTIRLEWSAASEEAPKRWFVDGDG